MGGWLMKRGEVIKNWRPRYFVLKSDGQLLGYKNKPANNSDPCNNFTVRGCQTMTSESPKPCGFALRGLYMDTVVERIFHTETDTNRTEWIKGIKYSFTTEDRLCYVTEYVSGGELFIHLKNERLRRFTEDRTRFYAAEIVCALGYLHKRGIIYRDLKLENLLLDKNGHIKMVDFGLCKDEIFGNKVTNTFCGTPSYLPPEVICNMQYGRPVDWWGLGVVLYELLTGQLPFYHEEKKKMYRLIVTEKVLYPRIVSAEARELISKLLTKNPDRRLGSLTDAEEVMEQAFFAAIDWSDLKKKRIIPPFKPELTDELDTRYVDPEFEQEDISLTPPGCGRSLRPGDTLCFSEFSYRNSNSIKSATSILSGSSRSLEIAV